MPLGAATTFVTSSPLSLSLSPFYSYRSPGELAGQEPLYPMFVCPGCESIDYTAATASAPLDPSGSHRNCERAHLIGSPSRPLPSPRPPTPSDQEHHRQCSTCARLWPPPLGASSIRSEAPGDVPGAPGGERVAWRFRADIRLLIEQFYTNNTRESGRERKPLGAPCRYHPSARPQTVGIGPGGRGLFRGRGEAM